MKQHNIHLLDLPNEILFIILKKLDNVDVLYSLLDINNQRLDIIAQEQIFSNILNFVSISQSTDEVSSISDSILDRFCIDILPRIDINVKSLILESVSMECILRAGNYSNLTELKIFNFNKEIVSRYFMDDSLFGHICKQQITDLVLLSNEDNIEIDELREYTKNVYQIIFTFFKNLKHLSVMSSSINDYPPLSYLYNLSPTIFSSSTLTKLCINVINFGDCLALLDGRFKQLTTFIVEINRIYQFTSSSFNMDDLPNLKCFSLISYNGTQQYDNLIIPLLRRMSHLEELTLYINIEDGSPFISGTHLDTEILIHMPRLHSFTFYFASKNSITNSAIRISNSDIERTFTNKEHRQVVCMVDDDKLYYTICRVFSLPFKFHRLQDITNNIPNIIFNSVTHLKLRDTVAFRHEFFIRLARAFPFLKSLSISNIHPPNWRRHEYHRYYTDWCSIVEYPHLISLDINDVFIYYIEHFLDETKTHLPHLTELKICYKDLEMVTENFTKNEMRRNCAKVKRLICEHSIVYPKDVYNYFPLLSL